ncbi:hypothetical protein ACFVIM_13860 [Streptomyces sp. NPDC057638]|uniref:hypothetical protein n=1 Tax=Streptomyces sp. NPDC057638 TaxID=3346190 RepID=UPI00367DB21C
MGTGEQLVTVAAVLLGALTTHVTNYFMERSRNRHALLTRWDDRKLEAYEGYIDMIRSSIYLAVQLYETREGLRESDEEQSEAEIRVAMAEAGRLRGRAFERIMLLGGDSVVEVAHELNVMTLEVDWQANGKITGSLEEWRERNRVLFRQINVFHDAARDDLGVRGSVTGDLHPERDLLLPPGRSGGAGS